MLMTQITTLDVWEAYNEYIMECTQCREEHADWITWLFRHEDDIPQDVFQQLVAEEV